MSATIRRSLLHALVLVLTVLGALLASLSLSSPAEAMSAQARNHVVHVAASKAGTPYRYGADRPPRLRLLRATPSGCSPRSAATCPRTSSAQAGAVRHVSRANRHRGDLVFFRSGGHVYHVGIYAGHNSVWHAPRPGQRVHREHIWTRSVSYGRVR